MRCQPKLPPEPNPASFRPLTAFACPSPDEFTFELGKTAEHSQHQLPWGVVVSAQASARDRKSALAIASRVLSRSLLERASLSRRVTRSSPRAQLRDCAR